MLNSKESSVVFLKNTLHGSKMASLLDFLKKDPLGSDVTVDYATKLLTAVDIILLEEGVTAIEYIRDSLTTIEINTFRTILTKGGLEDEILISKNGENLSGKVSELLFNNIPEIPIKKAEIFDDYNI